MQIRIGCSGYYYRHWQGRFYPPGMPASRWFGFYAGQFDTVEINASFYRFPTASAVRRWRSQAPDGFVYTIKAPKLITHRKRFHDCARLLDDLYAVLSGLGDQLGCILFQVPPGMHYSDEALAQLLAAMRPGFRNVFEFRHASWWRPEVYAACQAHGIVFCSVVAPGLPDELVTVSDAIYLRLHGDPWYAQDFSGEALQSLAERIRAGSVSHAWIYFNNDSEAFAPANAAMLRRLLAA